MIADPSKDLRDAASPARVLLSQSRQLAEQLQVRSAELPRRPHELRRWHDGLAGAPRAELAEIAAGLAGQVCELQAAADALTRPSGRR